MSECEILAMDDMLQEEAFSDNTDEYEAEQLEIALYSQIHFEENDEHIENDNNDNDNFVIDVQGNEKKGFNANETNADIILNEGIDKKYGSSLDIKDNKHREKSSLSFKSYDVGKLKSSKNCSSVSLVENLEKASIKLDWIGTEISQSKKIQALLRGTASPRQKTVNVEELILGSGSENEKDDDNSDDEEVITISASDDDDDDDNDVLSKSDSDLDSLDVVLGQSNTESETEDIKMNVHSNPRYTYKKMLHEDPVSGEEDDIDDVGHWAIDREDSFTDIGSAAINRGRYYKPIRCHNCNHVGHLSKNCPQPKKVAVCALCSEPGHMCRNCPQIMCFNCEEPGHDSKTCQAPWRKLNSVCYRCDMQGHDQNQCPDIWRQYHVTVTPGKIIRFSAQRKRKRVSCYNCGEEGHLGHECEDERMNRLLRVSSPFICRYNSVAQINDMVRWYDETEDRPIKRSRSEDWTASRSNRDNSKTNKGSTDKTPALDKDFNRDFNKDFNRDFNRDFNKDFNRDFNKDFNKGFNRDFNKDFNKDKQIPSKTNEKMDIGDSDRKNLKKQSPFAHIIKKRPDDRTGRNNFDKMQFTVLNKKNQDDIQGKDPAESSEKTNKKPKKKKKKKDRNKEKSSSQTSCMQEVGKEIRKTSSKSMDKSFREDISKVDKQTLKERSNETSGTQEVGKEMRKSSSKSMDKSFREDISKRKKQALKERSNERKVTADSFNMNLTIQTNSDFSEVFETKDKFIENEPVKITFSFDQKKSMKQSKKNSRSCSQLEQLDFTINRKVASTSSLDNKSDRLQKKYSNKRNDNLRTDDLFSLQKIQKLQSGQGLDVADYPMEEEDVEHQVDNNEWWRGKGKKKRRRKKKNKVEFY